MTNTWIIGCGIVGKQLARTLLQDNIQINATSHSDDSVVQLKKIGITTFFADLDNQASLTNLPLNDASIYYFAPPQPESDTDKRISAFLQRLDCEAPPRRMVYISTTGVYGDSQGEWVNEDTTTAPANARSKRRLNAEHCIQNFSGKSGMEYVILRVAGIYSTEKLPIKRISAGLKILRPDIAPASNRIHNTDLVNICIRAMQTTHHNIILNVADGNPTSISDYFIQIARLFNLTPPCEINWEQAKQQLSPEMLSYLTESKKVDPGLMLSKLGIRLRYPDLASGLIACKKEIEKQAGKLS